MISKFTLRTLVGLTAAIAIGIALLFNPTPRVSTAVINGIFVAIIVAVCLAAGMRQPSRSFWLGFALASSAFLVLDALSQSHFIPHKLFTGALAETMSDSLPPIVHRGKPSTTRYFRNDGRYPVYYYRFGGDGTQTEHGQMDMEQAVREGAFTESPLEDLPHIDNLATDYVRSRMLPYWLAGIFGTAGGLLSYIACRKASVSGASTSE